MSRHHIWDFREIIGGLAFVVLILAPGMAHSQVRPDWSGLNLTAGTGTTDGWSDLGFTFGVEYQFDGPKEAAGTNEETAESAAFGSATEARSQTECPSQGQDKSKSIQHAVFLESASTEVMTGSLQDHVDVDLSMIGYRGYRTWTKNGEVKIRAFIGLGVGIYDTEAAELGFEDKLGFNAHGGVAFVLPGKKESRPKLAEIGLFYHQVDSGFDFVDVQFRLRFHLRKPKRTPTTHNCDPPARTAATRQTGLPAVSSLNQPSATARPGRAPDHDHP